MAYAIARMKKLKGAGVTKAATHVDRTRDTPNADPEKTRDNQQLIGSTRPLRAAVNEVIKAHGGKPRKDSVECVELVLSASPEYFNEGRERVNTERVREFTEKAHEFLREQYKDFCVKAVLHLDEKTPHIHGFVVPIDGRGRLNRKGLFGTPEQLSAFQTEFAKKMEPLGLKRGVKGSRARHVDIGDFYNAINHVPEFTMQLEDIPEPLPHALFTKARRQEYKQQVIEAVKEKVREPMILLYRQGQLAREEKGKREAAEKRVAEAEREKETFAKKFAAELSEHLALQKRARLLKADLRSERQILEGAVAQIERLTQQLQALTRRTQDVPLVEVMHALGYRGERQDQSTIYRDKHGRPALTLTGDKAEIGGRVVAQSALGLLSVLQKEQLGKEETAEEAILWFSKKFGPERATAAVGAHTALQAGEFIREHERREAHEAAQRAKIVEPQPEVIREQVRERERERERYHTR